MKDNNLYPGILLKVFNLKNTCETQTPVTTRINGKGFSLEIEGLRAVAVIAVLLFHSGFEFIPGGFLGVDIFFVISGFLITSNILKSATQGNFSFSKFYSRRFFRLFPASATTVFATLAISFLLFPPDQVLNLAKSAFFSLIAVSNVSFWKEVGYFDTSANIKPLLHTWSLGVEIQFYLLWPATLLLITRFFGKRGTLWIIIVAGIVSLIGTYFIIETDPSAVFYLMPFRIFEFTIGAILALPYFTKKPNIFLSCILFSLGLVVILFSFLFLDSSLPMPSSYSLVPCLATAVIIYCNNAYPVTSLLSNPVMNYFGRISYSLYLVHWPVIIFATYLGSESLSAKIQSITISILVATLLFYCIERPLRLSNRYTELASIRGSILYSFAMAILATSAATYAIATDGLSFRLPLELQKIPTAVDMWKERNPTINGEKCFLTSSKTIADFNREECLNIKPEKKNYLIVGDSTAADLYSVLTQAYPNINFLQATSGNCHPIPDNSKDKNCKNLLQFIFKDYIPHHAIDGVILSAAWNYQDLDKIDMTIEYLETHVDNVILAGHPTMFIKSPISMLFDLHSTDIEKIENIIYSKTRVSGTSINKLLNDRFAENVQFINLQKSMCLDGCHLFTKNGEIIFIDFVHLTKSGATYLSKRINRVYPNLFNNSEEVYP